MTVPSDTSTAAVRCRLDVLLGDPAHDLVDAVLAAAGPARSTTVRTVRPTAVTVRPSGAVLVRYAVEVERTGRGIARETLVAATGSRIPDGAAVVAGEVGGAAIEVGLWRWPHDPALPALAHVLDCGRLRALLRDAGIATTEPITVRLRSYRPARRAVLAITVGADDFFAKVVPRAALPGLRRRHELLADSLPVPRLLAATDDGLALMPALAGVPGRAALRHGDRLPEPAALESLLDRMPPELTSLPSRPSHRDRARHSATVLALTTATDDAGRARMNRLADAVANADAGDHPVVAVHGDFYENQLLLRHGAVTGLLDVDTAGPGERIDDWATLLAHLAVADGAGARAWTGDVLRHLERRFDPRHLRPRVAAAVLGLATGPFRTQQPGWAQRTAQRVAVAQRWLRAG
ncbi:aminoglycoside phosphotransferase family protein [Saccharomonospora piscinae]|uniref:phosphotransferase n=1 Tax=Saccharomonospora piscinae TaxID=687388 RepID=UPI001106BFC2|nr:phosphotransferase [Saccharomonospora piscinae]TLW91874.1 aminoglycoside phosphotransferase family protein [Saccharomonospora piscinae]